MSGPRNPYAGGKLGVLEPGAWADLLVVVGIGDRRIVGEMIDAGRDGDHAADARRLRARDDGVALGGEFRKVEMAVCVDQHEIPGATAQCPSSRNRRP